ncbi:MAG: AAA family ATPase, partial [Desulfovibrionaceae bacterium]|nr:AAA family ATPase [Desulfovibrionaceae bacterium]
MHRYIYSSLCAWKNSSYRKPLLLTGARQTGKSWILKEFCKNKFEHTIIIDIERDKEKADLIGNFLDTKGLYA